MEAVRIAGRQLLADETSVDGSFKLTMKPGTTGAFVGSPATGGFSRTSLKAALKRYGFAFLFVALALVLTLPLQRLFVHPFLFLFFAAVMASGWYGSTGPGLLAVLLSTVVVDYFFVQPLYSFAVNATEVAYWSPSWPAPWWPVG